MKKSRTLCGFLIGLHRELMLARQNANQAFLTFSSILNTVFDEPTNRRLNALPRHLRSSVLRRVRLRSAMIIPVDAKSVNVRLYAIAIVSWALV